MKESIKTVMTVTICLIIVVFVTYHLITSKPTERKECSPGTHIDSFEHMSIFDRCLPTVELSNGWICFIDKVAAGNCISIYNEMDEYVISLNEHQNGETQIKHDKAIDRLSTEQLITECKTKLSEKGLLLPPP